MRNPLHALCPYFAVFPETFVATQVLAHTQPQDLVLDPFCGRGTALLESLLNFRRAIGIDVNPVAACIARAKTNPPTLGTMLSFLEAMQTEYNASVSSSTNISEFFLECFHPNTLRQILFLRERLDWQEDALHCFATAMLLGCLHGESHRSELYLSNRMPRTISTKPAYSVAWWKKNGSNAPDRDAFSILRQLSIVRLARSAPPQTGQAVKGDARQAAALFPEFAGEVKLLLTSPPYFDVTDYGEDQWLRLWFLGGAVEPIRNLHPDGRHRDIQRYWEFLTAAWVGVSPLLHAECTIAIRIGGRLSKRSLGDGLYASLVTALPEFKIVPSYDASTDIGNGQVQSFRPGILKGERTEHDFTYRVRKKSPPSAKPKKNSSIEQTRILTA